jgi:hypothetical protein
MNVQRSAFGVQRSAALVDLVSALANPSRSPIQLVLELGFSGSRNQALDCQAFAVHKAGGAAFRVRVEMPGKPGPVSYFVLF